MKYDRFVHIILRDGRIRAVISRASVAREILSQMKNNSMPSYQPDSDLKEYMTACSYEESLWTLERWPICQLIET